MHDLIVADPAAPQSSPLSEMVTAQDQDTLGIVREAIRKKRVLLAFQPVVQTAQPDKMAFYEGLLRVMDHKKRIIPARDFISIVEDQELGRKLDVLALEKGLEALGMEPGLRLSINMSARSTGYAPWMQVLQAGLTKDPGIAERLILEISERTAITMPDIVQAFMADLHHKGVSFALDDFGAGYTSFRYLRDFYFDFVKISGEYIRGIHSNPDNKALTMALVSVARNFDMFIVAPSVESYEDAEVLAEIGVDCMQGYYFGAPTVSPYWLKAEKRHLVG